MTAGGVIITDSIKYVQGQMNHLKIKKDDYYRISEQRKE